MRLLDLVEKDHRIGATTHGLGQLATLFIPDVAGRSTHQAGHTELLAVLTHVDTDERFFVVEEVLGERLGQLGFAHTGGSEEHKGSGRPIRVGDAGPGTTHGLTHRAHGLLLPDQAAPEFVLEVEQLLGLAGEQFADGNARPRGDDLGDIVAGDLLADHPRALERFGALRLGERTLHLGNLPVEQSRSLLEVTLALRTLRLHFELVEALFQFTHLVDGGAFLLPAVLQFGEGCTALGEVVAQGGEASLRGVVLLAFESKFLELEAVDRTAELVDLDRRRVDLHPQSRRGLINEVDGLVGEFAAGDVAVRECRGGNECTVFDGDLVVRFVAALEPPENRNGVFHRRLADKHLLEPAFERRILFDVLAVLVEGSCANESQLAAGEHGLEHVGCRHRTFSAARAHQGVQLVDEGDDLAVGVVDLFEHGLEPLFELTAILRASNQRGEVKRHQLFVFEGVGHVARDNSLGEALHHGGFAHAGFPDKDRVVFGAPGQNLADAPDLGVATDNGIEFSTPRDIGEVDAVLLESGLLLLIAGGSTLQVSHCVKLLGKVEWVRLKFTSVVHAAHGVVTNPVACCPR